jgi:hypothetical protein
VVGFRFLVSFLATLLGILAVLGGIAYAISQIPPSKPFRGRDSFRTGSFELTSLPGGGASAKVKMTIIARRQASRRIPLPSSWR